MSIVHYLKTAYINKMTVVTLGKVVDGKIIVEGSPLPEGQTVGILLMPKESTGFVLPPDDEAELINRIRSAEKNQLIDGDDYLQELRSQL